MTTDRDQLLSEFVDAWNAGRRPDIDEYVARAPEGERAELEDAITGFCEHAPTPDYDEATLATMRAEPAVAAAFDAYRRPSGQWATMLARWRRHASLSTAQLSSALVRTLGLGEEREEKTRTYLERVEAGELEPSGFSQRLIEGLADVLGVPRDRIEEASGGRRLSGPTSPALAHFRTTDESAAEGLRDGLEIMADAMATESQRDWDEVDELFRGGR